MLGSVTGKAPGLLGQSGQASEGDGRQAGLLPADDGGLDGLRQAGPIDRIAAEHSRAQGRGEIGRLKSVAVSAR